MQLRDAKRLRRQIEEDGLDFRVLGLREDICSDSYHIVCYAECDVMGAQSEPTQFREISSVEEWDRVRHTAQQLEERVATLMAS